MTTGELTNLHDSPKVVGDMKLMSGMQSPRTITLGNQAEMLVRGMTNTLDHAPQERSRFTSTAATTASSGRLPMLPALQLSPSRPIRIARRKPSTGLQPRYVGPNDNHNSNVQHHNNVGGGEDLLSASPSELKLMYDEATWRMYHLIQSARLEKQAAKAASGIPAITTATTTTTPAQGPWPTESMFLEPTTNPASFLPPPVHLGMPVVSPEEDPMMHDELDEDCVFELDDL